MFTHAPRPRWASLIFFLSALSAPSAVNPASGADWIHWRGPEQNGHSREKNLPDNFDPTGKDVVWKAPVGGRSSPLVMGGRVYVLQGSGNLGPREGERVVCVNESNGKIIWEYAVNVFHTDIVSSRLGWIPLTADPATGNVYAHTTGGLLLCLNKDGKLVWQRSLTEEFGRVTGYGGRIPGPIFDSGLVIVPMVSSNWGEFARSGTRFVALKGDTGEVVWWHDAGNPVKDTFCSNPVIAVINGQRLVICGGADGYLHALKVRTGEKVWSYQFCAGAANGSPIVDGTLVYCNHGDENPEGAPFGRVICVDAAQVDPKTKRPKLVWDSYKRPYKANRNQPLSVRFGLASMALADGRLYAPSDTGELYCFNAKTGEMLWKENYAREVRGAPLVADGKLYIFDVQQKLWVFELKGDEKPNGDEFRIRETGGQYAETNGTPIAVNGRLYFNTGAALYCLATPGAKAEPTKYTPLPEETKFDPNAKPAGMRLFPADVAVPPGQVIKFRQVFFDANGRELPTPNVGSGWNFQGPPLPKGAKGSPPLLEAEFGEHKPAGPGEPLTTTVIVDKKKPAQQGYVQGEGGEFKAWARVRVAPQIPYTQDFNQIPDGVAPAGWANTAARFAVVTKGGQKVLMKTNTIPAPPVAKANTYITLPNATDYTIQADLMGGEVRGTLADMGVGNCRYTLVLDGKVDPTTGKRTVRMGSWEARPPGGRIGKSAALDWQTGVWYTAKLTVEQKEKTAVVRGKVWKKGDPEPSEWTLEFEDPSPNREGAATLYGYISNITDTEPGAEIYYDNLRITPNSKK
jgi:outer membrane protein assembly factor BamB